MDGACTFLLVPGLEDDGGKGTLSRRGGGGKEDIKQQQQQQQQGSVQECYGEQVVVGVAVVRKQILSAIEEAVSMIVQAQHDDGYINSYYTVGGMERRWTNLRDMHELYCLGHLIEATVAFSLAFENDKRLIEVVDKAMRHVDSLFGPEENKRRGYPGHPEIELALLRFYDLTGSELSLRLARYFVGERGRRGTDGETYYDYEAKKRGGDPYDHMGGEMKPYYRKPRDYGYQQAACPVVEAEEMEGHAVRAMYLYAGVTDLVRLDEGEDKVGGEEEGMKEALQRLWRDMVDKKMYVTGGIGGVGQWEGFGEAYQLPDLESEGCYCETCATFGMIGWCQRLLRLEGGMKGEYGDVMELGLYNAFLGSLSADGEAFYYPNVLRTRKGEVKERSKWFGVACCPPNVAKLLAGLGGLTYSWDEKQTVLAVHLYIQSELKMPGTDISVSMTTNMPWSGQVSIRVQGNVSSLALRIPSWAHDYSLSYPAAGELKDGYLHIPMSAPGKEVKLTLPMSLRKVYAHPNMGKDELCIMRGPLVYCIEDADNKDTDIDTLALLDGDLQEEPPSTIAAVKDVVPIITKGKQLQALGTSLYPAQPWKYEKETRPVRAIPYFLRSNRGGNGAMRVWSRRLNG